MVRNTVDMFSFFYFPPNIKKSYIYGNADTAQYIQDSEPDTNVSGLK